MKKAIVGTVLALCLAFSFAYASECPRALAKEMFDVVAQSAQMVQTLMQSGNIAEMGTTAEEFKRKTEALEGRIEALSEADRQIFNSEFARLMAAAGGVAGD